ncbi:MAG: ATP-binding protein [Kiritimatiellae bacterium]|nr:ATP-binding protein [Kiritimatiellia bacterium]
MPQTPYEYVDATPVKSFFVEMLTRDIDLTDAMLDLLDNCVDGILRSSKVNKKSKMPYIGFKAEITFDKDHFMIHDNCGGIPWGLHTYAFRMGSADKKRDSKIATVGTYGIGMKRALFKMGSRSLITTQNGTDSYDVEISPEWIADQEMWRIPTKKSAKRMKNDGTTIIISELNDGVATAFGKNRESFEANFRHYISTHFAFILNKGFSVIVNGTSVVPRPTELLFDPSASGIKPYIFEATVEGVDIFLAVGFTQALPSEQSVEKEQIDGASYTSLNAGWTVICNDRAVLYCDKTELTGWGVSGVPRYHTQFIAISGIVEFRSNDASKLPMTTTKRGIDASSNLYLQVKDYMRAGMLQFIQYTNNWKGRQEEAKKHIAKARSLPLSELKKKATAVKMNPVRKVQGGDAKQFKPALPKAPTTSPYKRISFTKHLDQIETVRNYVEADPKDSPSNVGEKCFDILLGEAEA